MRKLYNLNKFIPEISQVLFDIVFLILSIIVCYQYRFHTFFDSLPFEVSVFDVISIVGILVVFYMFVFWASGLYKNMYIISPMEEVWKVIKAVFLASFIIFLLTFLDAQQLPRSFFLVYFVIITIGTLIGRICSRYLQKYLRKNRYISYRTIVIADYHNGLKILDDLNKSPSWGLMPYGYVYIDKLQYLNNKDENVGEFPVLGHIEFIPEILETFNPKQVIICDETKNHNLLYNIAAHCIKNKIKVKIPPSLYDVFTGQSKTNTLYGIPYIDINTELFKPWEEISKRVLDIVFSTMVLVLGLPFWIFIGLMVKFTSPGEIFYTQIRVGLNGRNFKIYKFRSMRSDIDQTEQGWTSVGDPRVTKFGWFIRKTHLDEIPQFWNVLKGDMSIVGPRPEQPKLVEKYTNQLPIYARRHLVRPGITGWWQINYKPYTESIEEIKNRLRDDFYYIENMSVKFDLEIIFRTVFVVLKGHGQA